MTTISVAEAKAQLSKYIRAAEAGLPIVITRHGKPVVAVVKADDLDQLERLRKAGPQAGLAGLAGGWEGSDELVTAVIEARGHGSRPIPDLDERG